MFKPRAHRLVHNIRVTAPSVVLFLACDSERPTFSDPEQPDASAVDESHVSPDGGATGAVDAQVSPDHSDAFSATHDAVTDETTVDDDAGSTQVGPDVSSASHPSTGTEETADAGANETSDANTDVEGTSTFDSGGATGSVESAWTTGLDGGATVETTSTVDNTSEVTTTSSSLDSGSSTSTTSSDSTTTGEPPPSCQETPEDPDHGNYPNCAGAEDGENCLLICDTDYLATANAECRDGTWTEPTCERQSSLTVQVRSVPGAIASANATVYVRGWFDPNEEECANSPFCAVSDEDGVAVIGAIPSGDAHLVGLKDGYEELPIPVHTELNEDGFVTLPLLDEGFATDHITLVLGWSDTLDMDLIVQVPEPQPSCLTYRSEQSLSEAPFAVHYGDVKSPRLYGPETVQIALNDADNGPHFAGSYRILAASVYEPLVDVRPEIRVIWPLALAPEDALNRVRLYRLPSNADEEGSFWHALNLNSDGSISVVNEYEDASVWDDTSTSELPCIAEAYP